MDKIFWCSDCKLLSHNQEGHEKHDLNFFSQDQDDTITALDGIIQYGVDKLQSTEETIANAEVCKKNIEAVRQKFITNYRAHVERSVKAFRESLEDCGMELLEQVNDKISGMEMRAHKVLTKSKESRETITSFVQQSATILPDEDGHIDHTQLGTLLQYYIAVSSVVGEPQAELKPVNINIKSPNSMQIKIECAELAKRITGELQTGRELKLEEKGVKKTEQRAQQRNQK